MKTEIITNIVTGPGSTAYGAYLKIENSAELVDFIKKSDAKHKAEVHIEIDGATVEMTMVEFLERIFLA